MSFTPEALSFLRDLSANNNKAWFEANRATYERAVKAPAAALVAAVSTELARRGLPLEGNAKTSTFRINRDVRFSKDKSPYKTTVGSVWYRQGSGKGGAGVLYFHLAPSGCFAAAAFYMPDPEQLDAIRERIRVHPDKWQAVEAALAGANLPLEDGDPLTRMPKGYEDLKDGPVAASLRKRHFMVRRPVRDAGSKKLVSTIADVAEAALPLLQFGWAAIDEVAAPSPLGRGSG